MEEEIKIGDSIVVVDSFGIMKYEGKVLGHTEEKFKVAQGKHNRIIEWEIRSRCQKITY